MPRKGVSGSGGFGRPTNFTEAEARVLWENAVIVPPAWHLPHGWNVSMAGYAVRRYRMARSSKPSSAAAGRCSR
jgi:hypothetical protein